MWMFNELMYIFLVTCFIDGYRIENKNYTLGVLLPYTGTWPIGSTSAGAGPLGVNVINNDKVFKELRNRNISFSYIWRDTKCDDLTGLAELVTMWKDKKVDVFIGTQNFLFTLLLIIALQHMSLVYNNNYFYNNYYSYNTRGVGVI